MGIMLMVKPVRLKADLLLYAMELPMQRCMESSEEA
jgi:hypothetical protein